MNKSITGILLASTTALAACGGGGGSPTIAISPPVAVPGVTNLGNVSVSGFINGFTSVVQQISADGVADAQEILAVFKWVGVNENIDTSELSNYTVDIEGTTYTLLQAWNMLKGYKKLYYDGKETFWDNMISNSSFDDADDTYVELKQLALADDQDAVVKVGDGTLTVDEFKEEKNIISPVTEIDPVVEEPVVEEPVVEEPVVEPVVEEPVVEEPVVEVPVVEEPIIIVTDTSTVSESTQTSTTTRSVGDPVVTISSRDAITNVVAANGDKTYTLTRYDVTTTSITTTTVVTTTTSTVPVTTVTYSNGAQTVTRGDAVVTVTPVTTTSDITTDAQSGIVLDVWTVVANPVVEEPVVEVPVVEVPVVEEPVAVTVTDSTVTVGTSYYVRTDIAYLTPVVTTQDVTSYANGVTTVTRITSTRTPETHTQVYAVDTTTVTQYSDGTTESDVVTTYTSNSPVAKVGSTVTSNTIISQIADAPVVIPVVDNGVIGEDHVDMGTRTPGYVANSAYYNDTEYNFLSTNQLSISKFDSAYSRGWTGLGSLVVVADSGALTTHQDLDANIAYTIDYTNTSMSNGADHGTHVAGIIAAERNGIGMQGAAFDAKLAIAKVSSGWSYSFSNALKAAAWGRDLGAVAMNVSAELNYDAAYKASIVKDAAGTYHSDHWYYGTYGYNGSVNSAVNWKAALGDDMVLVKASGNAGYDYSSGMNQMATATDTNGNLILDGQMIIVGNWNGERQIGNKAGTVCGTFVNGVCKDAAKISDFFIMAPGTMITSTAVNGGYVSMTGTSMAAPVVTGAVAVLHQMWPHMKGKNLVSLIMETGDKSFTGWDVNLHGQGLLDMDRATRPVGATGIPTTGRTDGGVSSVWGGAAISGVGEQLASLGNVMVLDSYERDFSVNLSDMIQGVDTRSASVATANSTVNYYAPYMNSDQHAAVPFSLSDYTMLTVGLGHSTGHFMGNSLSGVLGTTDSSTTLYTNADYRRNGFYAQAGFGVTDVNYDKAGSMLQNADTVLSSTLTLGYEFEPIENHLWGVVASQPVTIESASVSYNVPVARTLDGNVVTENNKVDYASTQREVDFGSYYTFSPAKNVDVKLFAEIRTGVSALADAVQKSAGFNIKIAF